MVSIVILNTAASHMKTGVINTDLGQEKVLN